VLGSALSMDKAMARTVLAQEGLPQVPWRLLTRKEWERDRDTVCEWVGEIFGFPCFVKPANMGSSVGVIKVHEPGELPAAIDEAGRLDRRILVEKAIDARELEIAVLGNDEPIASIVGEIVPGNEFYDYEDKYLSDRARLIAPAVLDGETSRRIRHLAIDAFAAIGGSGMARVDFFLSDGGLFVNEINTLPGFTKISMFPRLWELSGLSNAELVDRLVRDARQRHADRRRLDDGIKTFLAELARREGAGRS
jgi:D-alanine-D-alanine ligase